MTLSTKHPQDRTGGNSVMEKIKTKNNGFSEPALKDCWPCCLLCLSYGAVFGFIVGIIATNIHGH